ncbi:MAG TPA: DUF1289 domain-containing protein [Aquabacterium sp.]|uniref:DUF1289 domain-containing protein n=1 Tax=Aquabacterium sp. TaxID=1872578 RepID=UPI002E34F2AC|nr:DUF1289 domain-containing protein [Aquabacterium sp.]HEX5357173.1 DUF1289 domain-containing protein [Aquabacterium sp.]
MSTSSSGALPSPCPSPCVRLCTLNEQDVCLGCGRTLVDITGWTRMSDADKQACVAQARATLQQMGRPLPPYPPPNLPLPQASRRR